MLQCVCTRKCQKRDDFGKAILYYVGDTAPFDQCPPHFRPLQPDGEIDFTSASEQELTAGQWTFNQAAEAVNAAYNVELNHEQGMLKSDIVKQIMDARYRQV